MSDWKTDLQIASYKGVEFYTGDVSYVFGNKLQSQESETTPTDESFGTSAGVKSLQRKLRNAGKGTSVPVAAYVDAFNINAYLIGDLYDNRKPLIEKLKETNGGYLIHPTLGQVFVVPGRCTHKWNNKEGGVEYFELTFEQAPEHKNDQFPIVSEDTEAQLDTATETLNSEMGTLLENEYSVTPRVTVDSIVEKMTDFLDSLQERIAFGDVFDSISEFTERVDNLRSSLSSVIATPAQVMDEISTLCLWFRELFYFPRETYKQLENVFDDTFINPFKERSGTNARSAIYRDEVVLDTTMKGSLFVQMANVLSEIEYDNDVELASYRKRIRNVFDSFVEDIEKTETGDLVYDAAIETMTKLLGNLSEKEQTTPKIREFQTVSVSPALVLVYNEYASLEKEESFIDLNDIQHPLFVKSGTIKATQE